MTLHANGDTLTTFIGIERLAWLSGISMRQARADVAAMVRLGVLNPLDRTGRDDRGRRGGAGVSTEYHISVDALPQREPFRSASAKKAEADCRVIHEDAHSVKKLGSPPLKTRKFDAQNTEAHFRRSEDLDREDLDREDQPASPAIPFRVYAAIATQALNDALRDYQTDDISTVIELFKDHCAAQKKPYSGDLARKAVDAAMTSRAKARDRFERLPVPRVVGQR